MRDFKGQSLTDRQQNSNKAKQALIKKMREAMMNEGGLIQVKMAIADSLRNKRIVMIPTGNANSVNLQTLDLNDILRQLGVTKPK